MKKNYFILVIIITSMSKLCAQKTKYFFAGVGGSLTTFQDTKYSDVRYNGLGRIIELGYQRETLKSLYGINLELVQSKEKPSTHNATIVKTTNAKLQAKYLYGIKENFFVGLTWDALNVYKKRFKGLDNGNIYIINGGSVWLSSIYDYKKIRIGLDIGLASYFTEGTGFSYSAPQDLLEEGEFNYQNEALNNLMSSRYHKLQTIPKHLEIRTSIRYQFLKRFSIAYKWHFRKFSEVKNYPVTYGIHSISLRYNLYYRVKTKKGE